MVQLRRVALVAAVAMTSLGASAVVGRPAGAAAKTTCKQITKAQVQPLLDGTISSVKVTKAGMKGEGQQCVWSDGHGETIDLLLVGGSLGKTSYQEEVKALDQKVKVPGVAGTAYRDTDDYQLLAYDDGVYCSVSVGAQDSITGVQTIAEANGGNVPEAANTPIAQAIGTLCNRIFGSGSTKPDLDAITSAVPTATS
jgi:hypothetical protein